MSRFAFLDNVTDSQQCDRAYAHLAIFEVGPARLEPGHARRIARKIINQFAASGIDITHMEDGTLNPFGERLVKAFYKRIGLPRPAA